MKDLATTAKKAKLGRRVRRRILVRTGCWSVLAILASMIVTAAIEAVFVLPYIPDVDISIGVAIGAAVAALTATPTIYVFLTMQARLAVLLDQVGHLAAHDELTGLRNRRSFMVAAVRDFEESGRACAVMLVDIDRFKTINDEFGHASGDEVLRHTARVIDKIAESADGIAARLGGEEFVLMLAIERTEDAARLAEAIRATVEANEVLYLGKRLRVSVSVGVAVAPADFRIDWLLSLADKALYRAKAAGRNRVEWYPARPLAIENGRPVRGDAEPGLAAGVAE